MAGSGTTGSTTGTGGSAAGSPQIADKPGKGVGRDHKPATDQNDRPRSR